MSKFIDIEDVRSFVNDWNTKYPIDRWWRDKYNIPFGSPQHLNHSLVDMRIAFEDDHLHLRLDADAAVEKKVEEKYAPGRGDWLKKQPKFTKMTKGDVDEVFGRLSSNMSQLKNLSSERGENGKQKITI